MSVRRPPEAVASADAAISERLLQDAASMFAMLSATARLQLMCLLADGDRDVGTLARETGYTVPAVSHHLGKLKLAGLVRAERNGQRQVYVVSDQKAVDLVRYAMNIGGETFDPVRRYGLESLSPAGYSPGSNSRLADPSGS
jgi:DNA-binding transcriptional ArsR family regulator